MENAQFTKKDSIGNTDKLTITKDKVTLTNQHGVSLAVGNILEDRHQNIEFREALLFVMNQEGDNEDLIEGLRKEIIAFTNDRGWKFSIQN